MQTNCIFIPYNFVIHPEILLFSGFQNFCIYPADMEESANILHFYLL